MNNNVSLSAHSFESIRFHSIHSVIIMTHKLWRHYQIHFSLMTPLLVRRKNLRFMIFQKFKFIKNSKVMLHGWPRVTSSDQRSNHELTWFQITFQNEKNELHVIWFWFLNVLCSANSRSKRIESEFAGFLSTSGWLPVDIQPLPVNFNFVFSSSICHFCVYSEQLD